MKLPININLPLDHKQLLIRLTELFRDVNQQVNSLDTTITTYVPVSVTKNTGGTATGTVSDVTAMLDGNVYSVVETTGTPGFDIEFAFSNVIATPTELILRTRYDGATTHDVTVDLYRYSGTPGWDKLTILPTQVEHTAMVIPLPTMTNYLSAGAAKVRIYHNSAGNVAHTVYVDYIGLTNIGAGGSSVTVGGGGGGATNLTYTAATRVLASDTGTDATLPLVTTGDAGLAPASGGGTTNFLRADATWAAPTATVADGDKGDITVASSGTSWTVDGKDAANGFAMLNASSRITKGVDTTDDIIVDLATKGLVLKDTQGTPHYWRVTINTSGALVTTDIGTTKP